MPRCARFGSAQWRVLRISDRPFRWNVTVSTHSTAPASRLRALTADDFDYEDPESDGWEQLRLLCDELQERGAVMDCADEMFALMERLDGVDLGSPGPLVHALESTGAAYEPLLQASVERKPSPLSVWMVNRILNADRADHQSWLDLLALAADHPLASSQTHADARDFLAHQAAPDQR